jgi:hypothetical protein
VLDSYRSQLGSLPPGGEKREEVGRQMERDRDQLIGPLVDRNSVANSFKNFGRHEKNICHSRKIGLLDKKERKQLFLQI